MARFTKNFPPRNSPFITRLGQFQITFPNGIEVSAINHSRAYTEDRDIRTIDMKQIDEMTAFATRTIEVMVSKNEDDGNFFEYDSVMGHLSPAGYARLLAFIAVAPASASLEGLGMVYRGSGEHE